MTYVKQSILNSSVFIFTKELTYILNIWENYLIKLQDL